MKPTYKGSLLFVAIPTLLLVSPQVSQASPRGADFDGDGFDDLALGTPEESIGSVTTAGLVNVLYGSSMGLTAPMARFTSIWQDLTGVADASEMFDGFGVSLAWGDFDGDCFDDLVVGVSGQTVSTLSNAGAIHVFQGSSTGLSTSDDFVLHRDSPNMNDSAEADARFGVSLAAGDFNRDGFDDIAVGVYTDDVGTVSSAGSVHVVYGGSGSLSALNGPGDQIFNLDTAGMEGIAEASDVFGWRLAGGDFDCNGYEDLAVSVPWKSVGGSAVAGAASIIYGSGSGLSATAGPGNQLLTQANATYNIGGVVNANDEFGHSLAVGNYNGDSVVVGGLTIECMDLAVGVPGHASDGGEVSIIYGTAANGLQGTSPNDQVVSQNWLTILDSTEAGDSFGSRMTAAKADNDAYDDLVIGAFRENDVGAIAIIRGTSSGLTDSSNRLWDQNTTLVPDDAESDDSFGLSLSFGFFSGGSEGWIAVGVPFEGLGDLVPDAGQLDVLKMSNSASPTIASAQEWWQDSIDTQTIESGDRFARFMAPPRHRARCD